MINRLALLRMFAPACVDPRAYAKSHETKQESCKRHDNKLEANAASVPLVHSESAL